MLQASSQIEGDIYHNALSIEQGAMFEGKSRRTTDDPRAGVKPAEVPSAAAARPAAPVLVAVEAAPEPVAVTDEEASVTIVPPRLPPMR
jgi:hypothetical protein